ncbi:MAG: hypothetical protein DRQ65_01320 [Gammaproteobacteria bacterium]|nr:MAG: hypothetical protein DRQ98_00105 [Gammaproteobacteria bacterium]RLA57511.1 MAG: hypothetical protein DRQ65_01320 [Gammaproteobacteria bacterium]HDY82838.1 DUF3604 domain-containing protein [Halieaceae bacterium]
MKLKTFAVVPMVLTVILSISPAWAQVAMPTKEQVSSVLAAPEFSPYAGRFGVDMPDDVPMMTQERAYTSPIWYTP